MIVSTLFQNLGWTGVIRVDGKTYSFLGNADHPTLGLATEISVEFTATQTIFMFQAGAVDLTVTFLSPITVNFSVLVYWFQRLNTLLAFGSRSTIYSLFVSVGSCFAK